ncbi:Metal-staphylopine import system ATP-binding protein CntD [Paenibacillus solanacearum]|uniref:Metal-staphylopine import system ATP-binding protein CntD n=1 Tax=Paenibacillus solanacearum TaxID=2048548 RepID=A0A916NFE8_9BACL|nr:ABC transporter ATP-binding protein [Paenibacillus solanacearum]CAG7601088.1 Metal-staphylopine import system ATP-binding protein CntD [Paenibacillus solanacearum]
MTSLLEVEALSIWDSRTGNVIIPGNSFQVREGSCLAIVGESGSGKSVTGRAIVRLNKTSLRQSGRIWFNGENLAELSEQDMRKKRGKSIGMIWQHGMRAFDPSRVIGVHLRETLAGHFGWSRDVITDRMKTAMESVMLKNPVEVMNKYPHQLSGGMLQRIMIALALVLQPELVIADEPTAALDTVSQFEVVEQFIRLRERMDCALIFISHDLGIVKKLADDVLVMKSGEIVERGTVQAIWSGAAHEYTRHLVTSRQALNDHYKRMTGGGRDAER